MIVQKLELNARGRYAAAQSESTELLTAIGDELVSHAQANSVNPHWAHVGDLEHVNALLREIREFVRSRP